MAPAEVVVSAVRPPEVDTVLSDTVPIITVEPINVKVVLGVPPERVVASDAEPLGKATIELDGRVEKIAIALVLTMDVE